MLFRAICGLLKPDSGMIYVNGSMVGQDHAFPGGIGVIIENVGLWPDLTGYDNLKNLARIRNKIGSADIRNSIARVGLNPDDKRAYKKYSLGMKQRLRFAQAIMEKPELLILDETSVALEESGVNLLREIILLEQKRGATILLASHNAEDIRILCDKVYYMRGGELYEPSEEKE